MKRAFTLIELLVVIAIIAILAAILFPVFAQAKAAAKKTQCLSNMKNIGTAVMLYVNDVDDYLPRAQWENQAVQGSYDNITQAKEWSGAIYPYIKNGTLSGGTGTYAAANAGGQSSIFTCPMSAMPAQWNQYGVHSDAFPGCMPWDGTSGSPPSSCHSTVSMTAIDQPADKLAVSEKGSDGYDSNGPKGSSYTDLATGEWAWTSTVSAAQLSAGFSNDDIALANGDCDYTDQTDANWDHYAKCASLPRFRHAKSANVVFFDGHSKSQQKGRLNWLKNIYIQGVMPTPY